MKAIDNLVKCDVDFVALSANTPHIVFDKLQEQSKVPLVSIVEATRDEAIRLNIHKVGLIGTIYTMKEDFFKKAFIESGIEVIVPNEDEMDCINKKIAQELELGIINRNTLKAFQEIIERMQVDSGIEAIVLGCTELPLLLNDDVCPVKCLDTMKIHIDALINMIMEE